MGDGNVYIGNRASNSECGVRYCEFRGTVESLWSHFQYHHNAQAAQGSSAEFQLRWSNSAPVLAGDRIIGLLTYRGRRYSLWVLEEESTIHVYTTELRSTATPSPTPVITLQLSSGEVSVGTTLGVQFSGRNGTLSVSRQILLDELCQKHNGLLEAALFIRFDNILQQRHAPSIQTSEDTGIAETSAPETSTPVLSSSRVTTGASPQSLALSPIEKSVHALQSLDDDSLEDDSNVTVVEASPSGLFEISVPALQDSAVSMEKYTTFVVPKTQSPERSNVNQNQTVAEQPKVTTTKAPAPPTSKLPKPQWKY